MLSLVILRLENFSITTLHEELCYRYKIEVEEYIHTYHCMYDVYHTYHNSIVISLSFSYFIFLTPFESFSIQQRKVS